MAADAAELVRRALAVTLKQSDVLPRDVALKLAKDVESVALPVLNHSPAFTDHDLAEIVRASSAAKQVAVARRPTLSARVTTTPITPSITPSQFTGLSRSQPASADTAATSSGEEQAISAAVAAGRPSDMTV